MSMYLTTADVSRLNPPPSSPVETDVPIAISGTYQCGAKLCTPLLKPWTHIAYFPIDTDIRDSYPGQAGAWLLGNADTVHIPSGGTTAYVVIFVEGFVDSDGVQVKRVYLDRLAPDWPNLL